MAPAIRLTPSLDAGDPSKVISPQMPHMDFKRAPLKSRAREGFPGAPELNRYKIYLQH
jgi:hypothetical protein